MPKKAEMPGKMMLRGERTTHPGAQWFPEAGLGLFMHWGIVSAHPETGEAWDMRVYRDHVPYDGSGTMHPPAEFFELARTWNPERYDPDKWMKAAKLGGFNYAVLTTRHHDAYALWPSKFGDWHTGTYMEGRDLVKPYVEACHKNDMKAGFYFSGPSWYHGHEFQNYMFPDEDKPPFVNWRHEEVDELPPWPESLRGASRAIARGQALELLTDYGEIDLWWPDGDFPLTVVEVRELQPQIVTNNRQDNRRGDFVTPEGSEMMAMEWLEEVNRHGWWWEYCTIGHGNSWHWSPVTDTTGWGAAAYLWSLSEIRARGGNLLLNIAPRPDGEMPPWFYPTCEEMGAWLAHSREAIYEIDVNGPFPYPDQCRWPVTVKDNTWYAFAHYAKEERQKPIEISDVDRPASVIELRTGAPLSYDYAGRKLTVRIPNEMRADMPEVVKLTFTQ